MACIADKDMVMTKSNYFDFNRIVRASQSEQFVYVNDYAKQVVNPMWRAKNGEFYFLDGSDAIAGLFTSMLEATVKSLGFGARYDDEVPECVTLEDYRRAYVRMIEVIASKATDNLHEHDPVFGLLMAFTVLICRSLYPDVWSRFAAAGDKGLDFGTSIKVMWQHLLFAMYRVPSV